MHADTGSGYAEAVAVRLEGSNDDKAEVEGRVYDLGGCGDV
jgi:hypothetical protein